MAFTYPPNGSSTYASLNDVDLTGLVVNDYAKWNGTDWVVDHSRPGTLLSPQTIATDGGINIYTPLVSMLNNSGFDLSAPSALPISFDKGTIINGISLKFSGNLPKNGTKPWGEHVANPGWDYRVAFYNSDPVTGLPTTLRLDNPSVQTIVAADEAGGSSDGNIGWSGINHYVPANTPVWITIVSVPIVWPGWSDGYSEQDTYLYDAETSTFIQSNGPTAGRIKAAQGQGFNNNLLPISNLPIAPQTIFMFNNNPSRNALRFVGVNPFDYSGFGGPVATNLSTFDFQETWPTTSFEWPPMSGTYHQYPYTTQEPGFLPIVIASLD